MRRLSRLVLLVLSLSFIPRAHAWGQPLQTADEIIARYMQRVGRRSAPPRRALGAEVRPFLWRRRIRGRDHLRERASEQGERGVHLRRTHRRHRVRRQERLEDRAVGRKEGRGTARRRRDERHRRGRRVRRPAVQLQGARQHRLVGRHGPDRRHRRLQADGDARQQRRRAHVLSGCRVVRADQVRGEAYGARRGAVVRGGAGRLQGSAGRALSVLRSPSAPRAARAPTSSSTRGTASR